MYHISHGFSEYNEYTFLLMSIIPGLWAAEVTADLYEMCYIDLRYGSTCLYFIIEHACKPCALIISEIYLYSDTKYS